MQSMWLWKSLYNLLTRDWWYNELNTVDCFRVYTIMQSIGWKTNNTDRYRQIMTSFQTLLTWLLFVFNINRSVNFHVQNLKKKLAREDCVIRANTTHPVVRLYISHSLSLKIYHSLRVLRFIRCIVGNTK